MSLTKGDISQSADMHQLSRTKFVLILHKRYWDWCPRSSTWALTGFFWLLSHVIYLKLTKVLKECFLSQTEWWVVKVIFLSLRPEAWTFWKLNFVNPLRSTSHQKKLRKLLTFQACKLLSDKMTKTILPNSFFGYNCILSFNNWSLGKKTLL